MESDVHDPNANPEGGPPPARARRRWAEIDSGSDLLFFEGLHGAVVCDVPGGKMELAMQIILTPLLLRLMERRRRAPAA